MLGELLLPKPFAESGGKKRDSPEFPNDVEVALVIFRKPILIYRNDAAIFLALDLRLSGGLVVRGKKSLELC